MVMLELGFEGKRCSLRGKLEKGLPDRVNSGEGLETETVWKWGHVGRAPRGWDRR